MTCFHINEIKKEIKKFAEKFNNKDSIAYKKLGSIVNERDIGTELEEVEKGGFFSSAKYRANATYKTYDFSYVSKEFLLILLEKIEDLSNECNCNEDSVNRGKEFEKQLKEVKNELQTRGIESKGYETQVKSLEEVRVEAKDELNTLRESLFAQTKELTESKAEIASLRGQLIQSVERELDEIGQSLEIDEVEIKKLCKLYKHLFQAKELSEETREQVIEDVENKIGEVRKELKKKIRVKDLREVCERCEQSAKLSFQLEQRYEAKIVVINKQS